MYLLITFLSLLFPTAPQTVTVSLQSTGDPAGEVHLAVYADANAYENDRPLLSVVRPFRQRELQLELSLPAPGQYVLAAYHDVNGNGELDTNFFGAPSEPYGFNTLPPSKWRPPRFEELVADFRGGVTTTIELRKWKEY